MNRDELDLAMAAAGFAPDKATNGYRRGELWVGAEQAQEAIAAAQAGLAWTEDSAPEPLSETLAELLESHSRNFVQ